MFRSARLSMDSGVDTDFSPASMTAKKHSAMGAFLESIRAEATSFKTAFNCGNRFVIVSGSNQGGRWPVTGLMRGCLFGFTMLVSFRARRVVIQCRGVGLLVSLAPQPGASFQERHPPCGECITSVSWTSFRVFQRLSEISPLPLKDHYG